MLLDYFLKLLKNNDLICARLGQEAQKFILKIFFACRPFLKMYAYAIKSGARELRR
jgi:hypothetical protein